MIRDEEVDGRVLPLAITEFVCEDDCGDEEGTFCHVEGEESTERVW